MTSRTIGTTFAGYAVLLWAAAASGQDRGAALYEALKRPVPAAAELGDDPKPADLARARNRAAALVYNATLKRIVDPAESGIGGLYFDAGERLIRWSSNGLDARLDLIDPDKHDDRRKAIDDEMGYLRKLEAALRPIAERPASAITEIDLMKLEFYRVDLLSRRARIGGK